MKLSRVSAAALLAALAYLIVALVLLPAYGPTWDNATFEYPYGKNLLDYIEGQWDPPIRIHPPREPHIHVPPAPTAWFHSYPFASTLSALSCRVLWTELGLLPALSAHNLVPIVLTTILIFVLVRFVATRSGLAAGLATGAFLGLAPRYFAHSFNNLKDVPEACLYAFAVLAGYRALTGSGWRWWLWSGALTALALAQKANALFIPPLLGVFLVACYALRRWNPELRPQWSIVKLLGGSTVFLAVYWAASPMLWHDTWDNLRQHFGFVFNVGNVAFSEAVHDEARDVSFDGALHVVWTTPPTLLMFAFIGLFSRAIGASLRVLLLVWLVVPIGRTALPGMANFDGVRHFLEFFPPLCILAGLGLATSLRAADRLLEGTRFREASRVALWLLALVPIVGQTIRTHPNGICYFNFTVGGLAGAQQREIPEATDYWGNSYWQGLDWLDREAAPDSVVVVGIAPHIVECSAPVALRSDLHLYRSGDALPDAPLYVIYITRRSWYGRYLRELSTHVPTHEIKVQDGVILRIHRFNAGPSAELQIAEWERDLRARTAQNQMLETVLDWAPSHIPEVRAVLSDVERLGPVVTADRLRELTPAPAHRYIPEVIWLHQAAR